MTGTALIRNESIQEICGHRNRAVEGFIAAFDNLESAMQAVGHAAPGAYFSTGRGSRENLFDLHHGRDHWIKCLTESVDRSVWRHLITMTELERLMDRKARDDFSRELEECPPEVTPENCFATLVSLAGQSDVIFKRGIANIFSALDRRFRTHDGFKVGSKIILSRAFSEHGGWNHYSRHNETLRDIERTFYTFDGKPHCEYNDSFVNKIPFFRNGQDIIEDEYFKIRVFLNGNAHIWFKRDDLLKKVNLQLADYYGAVLGDGQPKETHEAKRSHAKNFGLFETPKTVVDAMIEEARIEPQMTVLEPSAGRGRIALSAVKAGALVTAIEIQHKVYQELLQNVPGRMHHADFLDLFAANIGTFDRIIMNPPFYQQADIDHVLHAIHFLKPGGRLVAIMSASAEFSETKKAIYFRSIVEQHGGTFHDLPAGTFKESGTMVNTVRLTLDKRAEK